MAITYNLPIKDWYYDETSEWTLDYPPLFAYFEFFLSYIAYLLKLDNFLTLTKDPIRTESIVAYQKITVILCDLIYYYAVYKLCRSLDSLIQSHSTKRTNHIKKSKCDSQQATNNDEKIQQQSNNSKNLLPVIQEQNLLDAIFRPDNSSCIALLLLLQPGLLMVDHIHFQYNGLLSGFFLLSVSNIISEFYISGSFWFAILLNFKHIYLYSAPAFGIYLLTSYCMAAIKDRNRVINFFRRIMELGSVVVTVFIITFSNFGQLETLKQIGARLFPFKRGLTHAYWAPNIWSLYNTLDKALSLALKKQPVARFDLDSISGLERVQATSTSGLVQEYEHQYLPNVGPFSTFLLVATFSLPVVFKFLVNINRPTKRMFLMAVTLASFTSFMFGWHVHEKAIIVVLLPLIPISFMDYRLRELFLRLTLAGTYSIFPLLFKPGEHLIKLTLLLMYYCYARSLTIIKLQKVEKGANGGFIRRFISSTIRSLYKLFDELFILAIILVELYVTLIHGNFNFICLAAKLNKYDFLPLLLTSSFSAVGIIFSYLELYYYFIFCLDDEEAAARAC